MFIFFSAKIGVRILATKLVEQWLKIAKGETMTLNSNNANNSANTQKDATPSVPPMAAGNVTANATTATATVPASAQSPTAMTKKPIFIDQNTVEAIKDYQPSEDPLDIRNESGAEYTTGDETDSKLSPSHYNDGLVYKLTVRDGKQILAKVNDTSPRKAMVNSVKSSDSDESNETTSEKEKVKGKSSGGSSSEKKARSDKDSSSSSGKSRDHKDKSGNSASKDGKSTRDRERERKLGDSAHKSSSSKSSKHNSSTSSEKDKDKVSSSKSSGGSSSGHKSSSSSHKSSSSSKSSSHKSSSSSSSSRDKEKHRSSASSSASSKSSSSNSGSKDKEKREDGGSQADKDKATLAKVLPQSASKMPKIPKKSTPEESADAATAAVAPAPKKSSISIEVRKDVENRPKTVKTFNSKFRSHGLAEEAPPPPSRRDIKKTTPTTVTTTTVTTASSPAITLNTTTPAIIAPKRSLSPTQAAKEAVVEKKIKLETPVADKPGAIKLIPAKPKRKYTFLNNMTNPCFSLLFIFAGSHVLRLCVISVFV